MTEQYFLQLNNNMPNRIKLGLEVRGETIFARLEAVTRNDSETITNGLIDNSVGLLELKPEFANNKTIKENVKIALKYCFGKPLTFRIRPVLNHHTKMVKIKGLIQKYIASYQTGARRMSVGSSLGTTGNK